MAAVLFAIGATLWSAYEQGITVDEPAHLRWSRRLLEEAVSERRSDPEFNSKTPITMLNVAAGKVAQRLLGLDEGRALLFWTRLPTVCALVALLAAVFLIGRTWVGERAAHLATTACALDPNLIAHGSLATVDVYYALVSLLVLAAACRFVRAPSLGRGAAFGLGLGLGFCTKFTAFLLLPGAALTFLAAGDRPGPDRRGASVLAGGLAVAVAAAVLSVGAAYRFIQVGLPLAEVRWESPLMERLRQVAPELRLPLPADFLTGFDLSLADERNVHGPAWPVVILGHMHPHGVWYYFLVLWLMKTPALVLLAQMWGYGQLVRTRAVIRVPALRFLALNLLLPLSYFSFVFHAQTGYRYLLMAVPLGYLIAAAGLESAAQRKPVAFVAIALAAVVESAPYLGNHLAFTNVAIQPKERVFRWITDSNVDWGQNRDKLPAYLTKVGLDTAHVDPPHALPGRNLLRFELASGTLRFYLHAWLREHIDPAGHFRHSYLLFDIDHAQFERLLDEARRMAPSPLARQLCSETEAGEGLRAATSLFARADAGTGWVVCVSAPDGADLVLRAIEGNGFLGRPELSRQLRDPIRAGQQAWYRLEPGSHVLAFRVRSRFSGAWEVPRGSASVRVRPETQSDATLTSSIASGGLE